MLMVADASREIVLLELSPMRAAGIAVSLAVAAAYAVVWPGWKRERKWGPALRFVLRWFHSLTWVLMAAWLWSGERGFGWAALVCYLVFLAAFARGRSAPVEAP